MKALIDLLKGKKTFVVALAVGVLGVLQALSIFTVPEAAWPVIAAVGLASLRAGVNKVAEAAKESS